MMPWANIWKTEPLRPSTVPVDSPRTDDAHVGHRGITDDVLQVGLGQAHKNAVDDADGGQQAHEVGPVLEALGAEIHGHPQDGKRAQLHEHAGVEHGHGGGRGHVAHGRPRVERPHRRQNPEARGAAG